MLQRSFGFGRFAVIPFARPSVRIAPVSRPSYGGSRREGGWVHFGSHNGPACRYTVVSFRHADNPWPGALQVGDENETRTRLERGFVALVQRFDRPCPFDPRRGVAASAGPTDDHTQRPDSAICSAYHRFQCAGSRHGIDETDTDRSLYGEGKCCSTRTRSRCDGCCHVRYRRALQPYTANKRTVFWWRQRLHRLNLHRL